MFYIIKRKLWNIWYKPDSVLSPVNFAGCSSLAALWTKFDDADRHYPIIAILARWILAFPPTLLITPINSIITNFNANSTMRHWKWGTARRLFHHIVPQCVQLMGFGWDELMPLLYSNMRELAAGWGQSSMFGGNIESACSGPDKIN